MTYAARSRARLAVMRIGELAALSGVSTRTIRYYEAVGLLPAPERSQGGYRSYGEGAAARIGFVRAAQAVGLRLGEIREVVAFRDRGETPCAHVLALLERRAREIEERIAALDQLRGELQALAARGRGLDPSDCAPEDVCHIIRPPRQR